MDELVGLIFSFEAVINSKEKISPSYGQLLGHLFAQLECKWRGDIFNVDVRSVQLTLLKRIFQASAGNLAVWTAAIREIRLLSPSSRELVINWILTGCLESENDSDWPVIFHNLLLMTAQHRSLLLRVFEVLYGCLQKLSSTALLDHLIFLLGQNGHLGREWIGWLLSLKKEDSLMMDELCNLKNDIEEILNS